MNLTLVGVFIAGVLSFFSPCIIPLIPMYVGFLGGDMDQSGPSKKKLYINALGFFIGLMGVFIIMGAAASSLGALLYDMSATLRKVLGVLVIVLGVFQLGFIKPSFLMRERKMRVKMTSARFGTAVLMGAAFSFGWTPCAGPIIAAVLILAADSQTLLMGVLYLVVYALGFAVPFAISTLLMSHVIKWLESAGKYLHIVKIVSGVLLIIVGYLIYANRLGQLTAVFS